MSRTVMIILLLIALLCWLFFGVWYHKKEGQCCNDAVKKAPVAAATKAAPAAKAAKATMAAWLVKDGTGLNLSSPAWVKFKRNSFNHLNHEKPVVNTLDQTAAYLKKNPKRSLTITGMYENSETNKSGFEDLGLARANNIKSELIAKGVSGTQFALASKLVSSKGWSAKKDTLLQGVGFSFGDLVDNKSRLADIKKRLFGKPLTLYFATGKDNINLTSKQRKDFSDMIYYLDNVPKSSLEISGHTDNVGGRANNVKLSKERAQFAQGYLKSNGISNARMSSVGHGPDKPIAKNTTAEGKAKNRRVEILLK